MAQSGTTSSELFSRGTVSIDEAAGKKEERHGSEGNLHSFPNAAAQHHPRPAVDKEIALLSFSISVASWY